MSKHREQNTSGRRDSTLKARQGETTSLEFPSRRAGRVSSGTACKKLALAMTAKHPESAPAASEKPVVAVPAGRGESAAESKPLLSAAPARDDSEYVTSAGIEKAAQGSAKGVTLAAGGSFGQEFAAGMANINLVQEAAIHLFTGESCVAFRAQTIRREGDRDASKRGEPAFRSSVQGRQAIAEQ